MACFSNLSLLSEEALTEQDKVNGNNYIEDHDITDVTDEYEADKGPEDSYKGPDIPENSDAFGPGDILSDVHTSDANNDEAVHESPKEEEENENSLEAIMAKRLGKGEGWNALKKTLKANKADILDMVSIRSFGIPKKYSMPGRRIIIIAKLFGSHYG